MQILTKVYERHHVARQVVTELEAAGFPSSSISLVANKSISDQYHGVDASNAGAGAEAGLVVGGATGGLLAGLGALIIPGLGPVVAAGWLTTTALGAFAGGVTGGILGALIDANMPEEHAHVYSEAVRRGGTLVAIRVEDSEVKLARAILDRHTSVDPVREGEKYRKSGWTQFDPATEYSPESIELERLGRAI